MGSIGMPELIVIFLVILMLFGSKKLPELARGLGQGIREFKRATNEFRNELEMSGVREEFDKGVKGSLDKVKTELDASVGAEPRNTKAKSKTQEVESKTEAKAKANSDPKAKTKARSAAKPKKENNKENKS